MRILYHHRTRSEDGQAVHVRALARAFEEEGHLVHEVALVPRLAPAPSSGAASRWSWIARLPRPILELAEYGYSGPGRRRLVGEAAHFEPDFVYERYAFGNAAGVLAARQLGVPLVLEVNSPMAHELARTRGLSFPGLARRVERFVLTSADRVCAVTGVLAEMLAAEGVERERLLVTPNGVRLDLFDRDDPAVARATARADLGLPPEEEDHPVLGFVGYVREWHRLDLALEALARPELARARLVLVGDGPARAGLERRASELGVRERLTAAGARPHERVPALLAALDVALLPAINPYASPLKLHEYMAAGLAVVAPDQANLREVLAHGENALLVPPGDAAAFGDAIARLCADPELRGRLGRRARATVVERDLTWRGNARRVVEAARECRR